MNRAAVLCMVVSVAVLSQCGASREVIKPVTPPVLAGLAGLEKACQSSDTIRNILISKAETLFITDDERYEATVTIFAVKDSLIYLSAVNNGFEILRGTVDKDSITVIDRMNRIIYKSPVRRHFGYQNPVDFKDLQNVVSKYFICEDVLLAREADFTRIVFDYDEPNIRKRISLNRETLSVESFEFTHARTSKYIRGEKSDGSLRIRSNFIISELEIISSGGTVLYNRDLEVKMKVNPRKYTVVNI